MRLDRLLANLGYGSRREVAILARGGRVRLDGAALTDPGAHLPAGADLAARLRVDDVRLDPPPPLTLVMHKPLGVVCSHKEPGRSIHELLPDRWRRRSPPISTVGRLDAETSGLILLTDDGGFLHKVISPRSSVAKRYVARLDRPLAGGEAAVFASGALLLEGETRPLAPARLEPLGESEARLTVHEGRYHQVRRMFEAVGLTVLALHRDRIGGLDLPDDLAPGAWRLILPQEMQRIFAPG